MWFWYLWDFSVFWILRNYICHVFVFAVIFSPVIPFSGTIGYFLNLHWSPLYNIWVVALIEAYGQKFRKLTPDMFQVFPEGHIYEILPAPEVMHLSTLASIFLSLAYFLFARELWKSNVFWTAITPTMHTSGKAWHPLGTLTMMDFQVSIFSFVPGLVLSCFSKTDLVFTEYI